MNTLEKKYGLYTAIAMVVGVVIGSGVFFKADDVLTLTNGNLILALVAWGLGAFSMIFGSLVFAEFAHRIEKSNGIVDYTEEAYGNKAGYLVGWFNWILYFSPLTAILAWVSSMYTMILMGSDDPANSVETWIIAAVYMIGMYLINAFSPKLAGRLQVGTTLIKLIPLVLIGVVGIFSGLINGVTMSNFSAAASDIGSKSGTIASAVVATAFAYEGWIIAITINSEIKDSKKNLPKALTIGAFIVFLTYIAYFLGISGVLSTDRIVIEADNAVSIAASSMFGSIAASVLTGFVVISCLGTLNGLVLSTIRLPYSLAVRNQGPMPNVLKEINFKTKMPLKAAVFSGAVSMAYLLLWYTSINEIWGRYIGLDEIPIVMVYGLYVFLYIWYMREFRDLNMLKRFVIPICALAGSLVILYGGITNPSIGLYLLISVGILLMGLIFYRK
ncbi:APC family permease [Alkalibacter mobilis]|uniref:APC family permease n=1 Tax=Alkalibacter mobilis TaxID=2787712 RepID=UPI001CECA79B|nr:amino acid permease [Alkalibacter mobilis]